MKLIMKADDFGSTEGVTDGIAEAITQGIVRDTSFLMNTTDIDYALSKAKEIGLTECGLHLVLTYGGPVSNPKEVPSLVQENGMFYRNPESIPKDFSVEEVEKEFRAQLAKFKETGLKLTHFDSHHHVHSLIGDAVYEIVMKMAVEENVPVRRQNEEMQHLVDKYGVRTTDCLSRDFGGNDEQSTEEQLISILDRYKDEDDDFILEIMCHPGIVDEKLERISSFTTPREIELKTITSSRIKEYIEENNIELVNFTAVK